MLRALRESSSRSTGKKLTTDSQSQLSSTNPNEISPISLYCQIAMLGTLEGRALEVRSLLNGLYDATGANLEVMLTIAQCLIGGGYLEEGLDYLRQTISAFPDSNRARCALEFLEYVNDKNLSIELLTASLESDDLGDRQFAANCMNAIKSLNKNS